MYFNRSKETHMVTNFLPLGRIETNNQFSEEFGISGSGYPVIYDPFTGRKYLQIKNCRVPVYLSINPHHGTVEVFDDSSDNLVGYFR